MVLNNKLSVVTQNQYGAHFAPTDDIQGSVIYNSSGSDPFRRILVHDRQINIFIEAPFPNNCFFYTSWDHCLPLSSP